MATISEIISNQLEEIAALAATAISNVFAIRVQKSIVNVFEYGVKGDGVTDDTVNFQAAIDANYGKTLDIPEGTYLLGNLTIDPTKTIFFKGRGRGTLFIPNANSVSFLNLAGTYQFKPVKVENISFDGNGKTGIKVCNIVKPRFFTLKDVWMKDCLIEVDRGRVVEIKNVLQEGTCSIKLHSSDTADYLKDLILTDVTHSPITVSLSVPWIEFTRVINANVQNIKTASLGGSNIGILLTDDCQGVFMDNVIVVYPTIGLELRAVSSRRPGYTHMTNFAVDQPSVGSAKIDGRFVQIDNSLFVNGTLKSNTGPGVEILANSTDVKISNTHIGNHDYDGLKINSLAQRTQVVNCTIQDNANVSGYDLNVPSASPFDPKLINNVIDTSNVIGQIVLNGESQKLLSAQLSSASTTAVTTEEDLLSYSLPAATASKLYQRLRIKAYGTTAANTNTKTVRLRFGSVNLGGFSGAINNQDWMVEAEVYVISSTSQEYTRHTLVNASTPTMDYGAMAENLVSALTIKVTGQNGVASAGDIVCQGLIVELL